MLRKVPHVVWAVPLAWLLYFFRLDAAGMLGPDEPRYAAIGREMARSGDWITPRLWGLPWFEKPALLYWMTGLASRLGLGPDLAPRVPVAIAAVAFLAFFWWFLKREFGARAAWFATLILATSFEWIGFSQVGVTDLPMAAAFSASVLLVLPWLVNGEQRSLPWAGAAMGVAVLAKGLVPLALAVPLVWPAWRRRDRLASALVRAGAPFLAIATPWYILCYLKNGPTFFMQFFWVHHVQRVTSDALQHVQPWWFYAPVFVGALLPWSPLLVLAAKRPALPDPRRRFLALIVIWGLIVFSIAVNKLPGYVLPLLPVTAVLVGLALDEAIHGAALLSVCGLQVAWFTIAGPVLPAAVTMGLSRVPAPRFSWTWLAPVLLSAVVWVLDRHGRRLAAVAVVAASVTAGMVYLKLAVAPDLDRLASARQLSLQVAARAGQVCLENVQRAWEYGLDYYAAARLPACESAPLPWHVVQEPGRPPRLQSVPPAPTQVDLPVHRIVISRFRD